MRTLKKSGLKVPYLRGKMSMFRMELILAIQQLMRGKEDGLVVSDPFKLMCATVQRVARPIKKGAGATFKVVLCVYKKCISRITVETVKPIRHLRQFKINMPLPIGVVPATV